MHKQADKTAKTAAWHALLCPEIQRFIQKHRDDDIRKLALKKPPDPAWPYPLIIDQIKARQKAREKILLWLDIPEIILPPSEVLEQASSAATARYKAGLIKGRSFADLTGGAGVDCCAFSERFETGLCVEQDSDTAGLIAHNMAQLTDRPVTVHHAAAEDMISDMPATDLIYIDPQRRADGQKGRFRFEDCRPDVLQLLPVLRAKTRTVLIKASPMLDIDQGIKLLQTVRAVHVVEYLGECREVLFILDSETTIAPETVPITAARLRTSQPEHAGEVESAFTFTRQEESTAQYQTALPGTFLFEPGPAFLKSGCFKTLAAAYGLSKLHPHTHLYTADNPCPDFPGRIFEVIGVLPPERKAMPGKKANLTVRNFPADVKTLRQKLKLAEGGEDYLFACTLADERKAILHARKSGREN